MALLVYGIVNRVADRLDAMAGVRDAEVSLVDGGELSAAVSEMPTQDEAPPVADLLAYSRVVEALHRRAAVIPMRYGCFVAAPSALERVLLEKQYQYGVLLKQLAGHVEMGVRVLLPGLPEAPVPGAPPMTGRDYLASCRVRFGMSEAASRQQHALLDQYNQVFAGLYSTCCSEVAEKSGRGVVSVYYLIPEHSIGAFRDAAERAVGADGQKTLVSGPWPPYSFVTTELIPAARAGSPGRP
jgi:hypothetical protein